MSECRDRARKEGWRYPSADIDCLPDAVRALAVTTGPRAAGKLAADTVEGAKTFGAARPLAVALGAQGEIVGGEEGVEMLERADRLLAPTPTCLSTRGCWSRSALPCGGSAVAPSPGSG